MSRASTWIILKRRILFLGTTEPLICRGSRASCETHFGRRLTSWLTKCAGILNTPSLENMHVIQCLLHNILFARSNSLSVAANILPENLPTTLAANFTRSNDPRGLGFKDNVNRGLAQAQASALSSESLSILEVLNVCRSHGCPSTELDDFKDIALYVVLPRSTRCAVLRGYHGFLSLGY